MGIVTPRVRGQQMYAIGSYSCSEQNPHTGKAWKRCSTGWRPLSVFLCKQNHSKDNDDDDSYCSSSMTPRLTKTTATVTAVVV